MKRLITILIIACLTFGGVAFANTVETTQALTVASQKFNDAVSSFNNLYGEDGSARGIEALYTKYGLSDPPTTAELNAMTVNEKADYIFELRSIIDKALRFEAIRNEFIIIDPGTGAFDNLAAVKTWAEANLGKAGVQIGKNCDVLTAIRATLAPFIATSTLKANSDAINAFRDKVTELIDQRGTG